MTILRACYKSGVRFDEAYYLKIHCPLAASVMVPHGVTGIEMLKCGPNPDGSLPAYQVMFSAHFASPAALQSAMQDARMGEVLADIPNFYDGMPDLMIGETIPVSIPA